MPAWVYVLAVCAVAWCAFVGVFHPFRKGTHAAPRGLPVAVDVYDRTLPVVEVEGKPPWLDELYDDYHPPPSALTDERDYLAAAPAWAAPEADRVTLYGGASGSMGSDYGPGEFDEWPALDPLPAPPAVFLPTTPGTRMTLYTDGAVEFTDPPAAELERWFDDQPGRWLDDQLAVLYGWVRDVHAQLAAT